MLIIIATTFYLFKLREKFKSAFCFRHIFEFPSRTPQKVEALVVLVLGRPGNSRKLASSDLLVRSILKN